MEERHLLGRSSTVMGRPCHLRLPVICSSWVSTGLFSFGSGPYSNISLQIALAEEKGTVQPL